MGVTQSTMAIWERGDARPPSAPKVLEIASALAIGKKAANEQAPVYLVVYWLLDHKLLAGNDGRPFVFREPEHAADAARRLEGVGFPDVAVLPVWKSEVRKRIKHVTPHEWEHESSGDPTEAVVAYATQLAKEFERISRST